MKKNHFTKIFVTYILIVFLGSLLLGYFSINLFKYYFISAARVRMNSNINLIKSNIMEMSQNSNKIDFNYLAKKYSEDIGATVTFIDFEGNVVGERLIGFNKNNTLFNQVEIQDAKKDMLGYNFFYNNEEKVYILNIASFMDNKNFKGFIHLSAPLAEVKGVDKGIMSYALIGVIFILISSFILKILFEMDIIKPLEDLTNNSNEIKKGNLKSRLDINSDDVIGIAVNEYNAMLDNLEKKIDDIIEKDEKLELGLSSADLGIVIIALENRISFANESCLKIFNSSFSKDEIIGKKIIELIKDSKINNIFNEVFKQGLLQETEVEVENNKILKVTATPIINNNVVEDCFVIITDITQIKKIEQMGSDFVSNVTHELKTPLTSIKGFIETLKDGAFEDKEVAYKFLGIIDTECERLSSLINDILQLSELQNRKRDVNLNWNYIQEIIPEVISFLEGHAQKKNINLSFDVQNDIPLMLINKNRIRQMLINIIENAIKYTQPGGEVFVLTKQDEQNVVISVKDNGIGISEQALSRLFERFYRADKGRSRSQGGTGLGLSIVKHIVDLYDGKIEVKSEVEKGTEFIITLPIKVS